MDPFQSTYHICSEHSSHKDSFIDGVRYIFLYVAYSCKIPSVFGLMNCCGYWYYKHVNPGIHVIMPYLDLSLNFQ